MWSWREGFTFGLANIKEANTSLFSSFFARLPRSLLPTRFLTPAYQTVFPYWTPFCLPFTSTLITYSTHIPIIIPYPTSIATFSFPFQSIWRRVLAYWIPSVHYFFARGNTWVNFLRYPNSTNHSEQIFEPPFLCLCVVSIYSLKKGQYFVLVRLQHLKPCSQP